MEQGIRKLSWAESIKISGHNLKYRALSYLEESPQGQALKNFHEMFLLGERFAANPDNHKFLNERIHRIFGSTVWATYRSLFSPLKDKEGFQYITDAGWGCMIRAGQMYIAQTLKKHLKLQEKQEIGEILKLLDDYSEQALFSIQNIAKKAQEEYSLYPGTWYNPSQIIFIIKELFERSPDNPYRQSLGIVVMNNATLFFDQIIKKMANLKEICGCKKQQVVCYKCCKKHVSVSVVFLVRIGVAGPEKKYLNCLNKMIEFPFFQGIVGGKPQKALFILGKIENKYIYLDPHLVQSAVSNSNLDSQKNTYFCNSFRSCNNSSIDPSMGVCFYLQDLKAVDQFYRLMSELKQENSDEFFLYLSEETPAFMSSEYCPPEQVVVSES